MAFTSTIHHGPYLLVVATGPALLCDLLGLVDMAARIARSQGYSRMLVDLVTVHVNLTYAEHEALGEHVARSFVGLQVASVVDERYRVGTSERRAQAAGLDFRTFTSLSQATDWLSV